MFVITTLAVVGLPMLNGFVGEFLILAGSMQSAFTHHILWTTIATTGVILSASYMLWMIQRVFYGDIGYKPDTVQAPDLNLREHVVLWTLAVLFLVMGVRSTFWLRAIDQAGVPLRRRSPPASDSCQGLRSRAQRSRGKARPHRRLTQDREV